MKKGKFLGATVQEDRDCGREVMRVQAGWNGWRKISGIICVRKVSSKLKGRVYSAAVRPATLYATLSMIERQEEELDVAELIMLRFETGVTRMDKIGNKYIRGSAGVERLGKKLR
ncbi:uncharacterized protein [Watersipora subatra]|uniref:uncharacterized protein n=1 Tax=Watersipora subatra TaxID=2589382 RepID=UPI00355BAA62